jgi:hypothetical protein
MEGQNEGDLLDQGKAEGFADDTTALTLAEEGCLVALKEILNDFANFSGLKANFSKCLIIPLGFNNVPVPNFITNSGFEIGTEVTILGMRIFDDTNKLSNNFDKIIEQLINLRNFWSRFSLSLPGRIEIAKCLMLSKIGYLGWILNPNPGQLNTLCEIIDTFIRGRLVVSKKKTCEKVQAGGLGMIDIKNYLVSLKCSWMSRSLRKQDDFWSKYLQRSGCENLDNFSIQSIDKSNNPILGTIYEAARTFSCSFLRHDNNILESRVLLNPVFGSGQKGHLFNENIFESLNIDYNVKNSVKVKDLIIDKRAKTKLELENMMGCQIPDPTYTALVRGVRDLRNVLVDPDKITIAV